MFARVRARSDAGVPRRESARRDGRFTCAGSEDGRRQDYACLLLSDRPPTPPLPRLALHGLSSLLGAPPFDCRHKGFAFSYEKRRAIDVLRALVHAAHETLDPSRVEEWATEVEFKLSDVRTLADYTERVRGEDDRRPPFRDEAGRPMYRDRDREQRMVDAWREELAADSAVKGDAA